jgi:endonuclease-3
MASPTVSSPPERRMRAALRRLQAAYPDAQTSLTFRTPWELLVATILSAQCTDERVNQVTPALFAVYPGPQEMAGADQDELVRLIFATGFHNAKARSLRGAAQAVLERHGGEVPRTMAELVKLPGVGRKTAAVVLGNAYGRHEGIAVDTHVQRLVRRLGFSDERDPKHIEQTLLELVPRRLWTLFTHLFIAHGRAVCTARAPRCDACVLLSLCPEGRARTAAARRLSRSQRSGAPPRTTPGRAAG